MIIAVKLLAPLSDQIGDVSAAANKIIAVSQGGTPA
jgi:hypothetical protein